YLTAIRSVQGSGPYYLGGYSFGGLVAFEMVRQLIAARERAGALILVDTALPTALGQGASFFAQFVHLTGLSIDEASLADVQSEAQVALVAAAMGARVGIASGSADGGRRLALYTSHLRALQRYAPSGSLPRLDLLRAARPDGAGDTL